MPEQDNRRLHEELFAALNARDIDRYVRNLHESHIWESETLPAPVRGPEATRRSLEMYFSAFPDLHFEIEQILTTPNHMVSRWRVDATHKGEFAGIAPTNRKIHMRGCSVSEVQNGKLTRTNTYSENATLFQQLGVLKLGKAKAAG